MGEEKTKDEKELIEKLRGFSGETVLLKPHGKKAKEIKLEDLEIEDLEINKDVALIPFKEQPMAALNIHINDLFAKITA